MTNKMASTTVGSSPTTTNDNNASSSSTLDRTGTNINNTGGATSSVVGNNPNLNSLLSRGLNDTLTGNGRHQPLRQHPPSLSNMREFCLRWNHHQPNMVTFFSYLLGKESFVDVTLVSSEGKKIQAHKLILSACSPYFQHVFENNPCKHPIVILKDVQYADLRTIISFIYNGEVNIAQDRMSSILATASTLQVKGLADVSADEFKQVGGVGAMTSVDRHQSQWTSGESDIGASSDIPRKRLKKAHLTGIGQSTNGDMSGGSFESGMGASVSRSLDDGTVIDTRSKSPPAISTRPPQRTAVGGPKSSSLDTGLDRDRRIEAGDSELSSGSFAEHQHFDESPTGAERGYDLEVADLKDDDVDNDDGGELDIDEDDSYGPDDNPDQYGDPSSYLNMPASSSASFFRPSGLHFGSKDTSILSGSFTFWLFYSFFLSYTCTGSIFRIQFGPAYCLPTLGGGHASLKGRRGRPLIRQPRVKRIDLVESKEEPDVEYLSGGASNPDSDDETVQQLTAAYRQKRFGIRRDSDDHVTTAQSIPRQQSIPILMVSGSSPTPPSSPPPLSIDESPEYSGLASSSTKAIELTTISNSTTVAPSTSGIQLLNIPISSEQRLLTSGGGSITTGQAAPSPVLVKQISQPVPPSHHGTPSVQRQHSTPSPIQSRNLKSKTLTYLIPPHESHEFVSESTYIMDPTTGVIQILSPVQLETSGISTSYSRISSVGKEMEILRPTDSGDLSSDEPTTIVIETSGPAESSQAFTSTTAGTTPSSSFSISIDEDSSSTSGRNPPVQRAGHCPVLRPGPALGCNFCWNSVDNCGRILRRKTRYHCPECKINLCIVPCFQEYHEKNSEKKKPKAKLSKPSSM